MEPVKQFWDQQAIQHGDDDRATAPDHYYRELEIKCILEALPSVGRLLDIGCGNGYSTFAIERAFPRLKIKGVDYSEEMISVARKTAKEKGSLIDFKVGNVLEASQEGNFSVVLSERCLINLKNWDEQREAIKQLREALVPNGRMILVENCVDGLERLNGLRELFGLPPIAQRWHNCYLPDASEVEEFLYREVGGDVEVENIGNLYYIISRVAYAALAQKEGKEPSYDHVLNEVASKLPSLSQYRLSPNYMFTVTRY